MKREDFRQEFTDNAMRMTRKHANGEADIASLSLVEQAADEAVDYAWSISEMAGDDEDVDDDQKRRLWMMAEAFAIGFVTAWKQRDEVHHAGE